MISQPKIFDRILHYQQNLCKKTFVLEQILPYTMQLQDVTKKRNKSLHFLENTYIPDAQTTKTRVSSHLKLDLSTIIEQSGYRSRKNTFVRLLNIESSLDRLTIPRHLSKLEQSNSACSNYEYLDAKLPIIKNKTPETQIYSKSTQYQLENQSLHCQIRPQRPDVRVCVSPYEFDNVKYFSRLRPKPYQIFNKTQRYKRRSNQPKSFSETIVDSVVL